MLVLTTPRLWLRPVWPEDARDFARLITFDIARNTARMPWPYTQHDADAFVGSPVWPEADLETARASIVTREWGELIGCVGFGRNLISGKLEFGYWLAEAAWGRGYATEAATAWVDAAFGLFRLPELHTGYFEENPASGRVLEKLGFRPTGEVQHEYPCLARRGTAVAHVVRQSRGEWLARTAPAAPPA